MKECVLYKKEKSKKGMKVRCLACSHKCLITEGKTGICGVRKNISGKLYLLVYGKVASMAVDPIEKKPLYHFLPKSYAFSIGTVGCNFKCDFCQNFNISQASKNKEGREGIIFGKEISPLEIVRLAVENHCQSVAYTYNEPSIFVEFVKDIAEIAKGKRLKNVLVTNGYLSKESFDYLNKDKLIDAMNIDLKSFNEKTYNKFCGAKLKPVLDTIKKSYKNKIHIEITTLIIPGINDSSSELSKIAKFIYSIDKKGNIPWHISRYFPMYKFADGKHETTPLSTLERTQKIGEKAGLNFVYLGNV